MFDLHKESRRFSNVFIDMLRPTLCAIVVERFNVSSMYVNNGNQ